MQHIYFDLPEHRLIFIATPHCATTTLFEALEPLLSKATKADPDRWAAQAISKQDVVRLKADRLVFGTVRNPWDRVVAQYDALVHPKLDDAMAKHSFARDMSFAGFVGKLSENKGALNDPALCTQTQLLLDSNDMLLPDVVLRYERLETDFQMLAALIAARTGVELPVLNLPEVDAAQDFGARYTRPPRIKVREIYSRDVNFFYYHFPAIVQDAPVAA